MLSSDRWPRSGSMLSGECFERPMLAPLTVENAGSALLKTPTGNLGINGGSQHPDKRKAGGHGPTLADEVEHLLPTPRSTDGPKGGPGQVNGRGVPDSLPAIGALLPTPTSRDWKGENQRGDETCLPGAIRGVTTGPRSRDGKRSPDASRLPLPTNEAD